MNESLAVDGIKDSLTEVIVGIGTEWNLVKIFGATINLSNRGGVSSLSPI